MIGNVSDKKAIGCLTVLVKLSFTPSSDDCRNMTLSLRNPWLMFVSVYVVLCVYASIPVGEGEQGEDEDCLAVGKK